MQPEPLAGHHTQMTVPSQPFAELASFLEFVPDAMVIINQDGTMVLVNAQTEHLFGYGRHELIGKPVEMLVPQRFRARHVAHRQAYFGAPCPRLMGDDGELCARRQDGSEFAMEISLKPFETTEELLVSCAIRNITERKQLEQELRASEQHLHLIMDSVPALIAYVDKNLRYQFVNRTFARWHDIPTTNIAGTHLSDIRSERAYQQLRQYAERVLSGRQFSTETAMPKRHGGSRDVHATYTPHVDQQGNVQGYFALVQDITEHKQTERNLQESTERLRLLLETTDAIPWEADAKTWRFTYVGPQVETLFGYPLAQWYEEDFWAKHLHPDDRDSAIDFCLHASSRREQYAFEYRMVTADGGIVWLQDMVRVVQADGVPITLRGFLIDITEHKHRQAALEERLRFQTLLSELSGRFINIPVGSIDQEIKYGLKRLVEFLDVDRGAVLQYAHDTTLLYVTHQYAVPGVPRLPAISVNAMSPSYAERVRRGEALLLERSDDLPVEARRTGLKSNLTVPLWVDGSLLGAITLGSFRAERCWPEELVQRLQLVGEIFANALVRRRTDDHSRQLRDELAHVSRVTVLGELTAALAHELNQPLTAIQSNAQAAQRFLAGETPGLDELHEILGDIIADNQRAAEIIRRLRAMMTKHVPTFEPLSLNTVIREVIPLVRREAVIQNISLHLALDESLPPVLGDRVELQQVLLNLIMNGFEAMTHAEAEGRQLYIKTALADPETVTIAVQDSGVGLDEHSADRLFEPFVTTKPQGLGMGLSISRSIIAAHGGRVWATSNSDCGATFHIALPVAHGKTL